MNSGKFQGHLAVGCANLFFGLNIPVTKSLLTHWMTPMGYMIVRATSAALLFWIIGCFIRHERVERKDLLLLALGSLLGFVLSQFLTAVALEYTSPVYFSLIAAMSPVMVMLLAVISVASYSVYLIIMRTVSPKYAPVTQMKWTYLFACIILLPFGIQSLGQQALFTEPFSWEGYGELAFIILFATIIGYTLVPFGMKHLRATTVSIYMNLQPVVASLAAILVGQDTFTWDKPIAALLVIAGAYVVTTSPAKEPAVSLNDKS